MALERRTFNQEDDRLGFVAVGRLGDVGLQAGDVFDGAGGGALLQHSGHAAGAHSYVGGHGGGGDE